MSTTMRMPSPCSAVDELVELRERADARVDVPVVVDVVAAVRERGGVERAEPDGIDAEPREVRHPVDQPGRDRRCRRRSRRRRCGDRPGRRRRCATSRVGQVTLADRHRDTIWPQPLAAGSMMCGCPPIGSASTPTPHSSPPPAAGMPAAATSPTSCGGWTTRACARRAERRTRSRRSRPRGPSSTGREARPPIRRRCSGSSPRWPLTAMPPGPRCARPRPSGRLRLPEPLRSADPTRCAWSWASRSPRCSIGAGTGLAVGRFGRSPTPAALARFTEAQHAGGHPGDERGAADLRDPVDLPAARHLAVHRRVRLRRRGRRTAGSAWSPSCSRSRRTPRAPPTPAFAVSGLELSLHANADPTDDSGIAKPVEIDPHWARTARSTSERPRFGPSRRAARRPRGTSGSPIVTTDVNGCIARCTHLLSPGAGTSGTSQCTKCSR